MPRLVELVLWFILAMLTVVLPNAFKEVSAGTLTIIAVFYLLMPNRVGMIQNFLLMWFAAAVVTAVYIFVGYVNSAPKEAYLQVFFIYIVSPLLWAIALHGAIMRYGIVRIVDAMVVLMFIAIASQAFYFWAFAALGPQAVEFMAGNPNVDLSEHSSAAVMYVFGSMIFLYGGLMASPEIVRSKVLRYVLILLAFGSTFTSGRSALILSLFIGVGVSLIASPMSFTKKSSNTISKISIATASMAICGAVLAQMYGIDVSVSLEILLEKIVSAGGAGRSDYSPYLFYGAVENNFLGAGHGIGVQYVVNERFPWRYEIMGLATLYRVGIVGTAIYTLPFVLAMTKAIRLWRANLLVPQEKFLCGAMITALVGTNTNPYIEAFAFQWMYVLPCLYFIGLRRLGAAKAAVRSAIFPQAARA